MCIDLTYSALNGVDVPAVEIRNAYLQAPSYQRDYIVFGPKFGLENVEKKAPIRRTIYGGKSTERDLRNHV